MSKSVTETHASLTPLPRPTGRAFNDSVKIERIVANESRVHSILRCVFFPSPICAVTTARGADPVHLAVGQREPSSESSSRGLPRQNAGYKKGVDVAPFL